MDERMAYARLRAATLWPYFSSALFSLVPIETDDISRTGGQKTMGVDKNWRLIYHSDIFNMWTVSQVAAVLVHEVMHLLRDHPERAIPVKNEEFFIWNLAADCEINDDLKSAGLPDGCIYPSVFGFKDGLIAEEYFELLKNSAKAYSIEPQVGGGACGSCATGQGSDEPVDGDKDSTSGNKVRGVSKQEAQVIKNEVAKEVAAAKGRGNIPNGIARWAEKYLKSHIPWRTLLSSCIRGVVGERSGMVNYTYAKPCRRQSSYGKIIMPCLRAPIPNIAMLIDTSGSMSEKDLGMAVAEVDGVLKSIGASITVISNDAEVGAVKKVRTKRDIELVGGGGTNMGPGIERAATLRPKTNFLIIVSDCDAAWGNFIPQFPVLVVRVGSSKTPVPDWIKKVIDVED
jgi:predicted metal-dependent peptidase